MSSVFGNILKKIYDALPTAKNPAIVRGMVQKWRDDFPGSSLSPDNWEIVQTGSGQSIAVTNSELRISAGTVANAQTIIRSKNKFTLPCRIFFIFYFSQRIVNQDFFFEIVDQSGNHYARVLFNNANVNTANTLTANTGDITGYTSFNTQTTVSYAIFEIDVGVDEIKFASRTSETGAGRNFTNIRNRKLPDPNLEYFIQIRAVNSGASPASNTILYFDSISYQSLELLTTEIAGARGSSATSDAIPVSVLGTTSVGGTVTSQVQDNSVHATETSANLTANATFTGVARDAQLRSQVVVTVLTDQPGTLYIDQSADNSLWLDYPARNCIAGVNTFSQTLGLRYFRVRYVNGANAQTNFRIYSVQRAYS